MKPGILIICPFYLPNLGGVETHLDLLTKYLVSRQIPTTVLTYKPLTTQVKHYETIEHHRYLSIYRFWYFGRGLFDKLTPYPFLQFLYIVPGLLVCSLLFMVIHHQDFRTVHAHGFAAAFIARILKLIFPHLNIIISTHFIYQKLDRRTVSGKLFKWVFSAADTILLISQKSGSELVSLGLDAHKMKLFHHWLDPQQFKSLDKKTCRQFLNIPTDKKLSLVYIGRIIEMKGVFLLKDLAKKLPTNIQLILVGDGPDFIKLKSESSNLTNFKMLGRVSHQQIVKIIGASDLVILPSLAPEAQPMTIMEALMCGRPVIITDQGSASEMIDRSVGITVVPQLQALYNTIMRLYRQPALLTQLTKPTRAYALKHFNTSNAQDIIATYQFHRQQ